MSATLVTAAPDPPQAAADPSRRRVPSWLLFTAVLVGAAALVLVRNRWLFSQPIGAEGDFALNGLLADQARHFSLWQGNYSRVGFHHPGPAGLYVMMVGEVVAHSWLHVVPAATNGMVVGQVVFDAALLATIALVVRRTTGSALGGIAVAALVLLPMAQISGAADPWPPYQYMPAFALFVVSAMAVAGGVTRAVTAYVVGAGLIAHGQVSFLLFVAVTTVVVAAGWWWSHRREVRDTAREATRRLQVAAGVLAVFLLPLVLQTVFHDGGPWLAYYRYTTGEGAQHNPLGPAIGWLGWYVSESGVPMSVAALAVVVLFGLAVTERDAPRRRRLVATLVVGAVEALLVLVYALRGVDGLGDGNRYLVYFALVLAPVVAGVAFSFLVVRVAAVVGPRVAWGRAATVTVAAVGVAGLVGGLAADAGVTSRYRGLGVTVQIADALAGAPARADREVSLRLAPDPVLFQYTAGVVYELEQRGIRACVWSPDRVVQKQWVVQFTAPYACDPADLGPTYALVVQATPRGTAVPGDAVFHDALVTLVPTSS